MIQDLNRTIQICKNLLLGAICFITLSLPVYSIEYGQVDNSSVYIDSSKIDKDYMLQQGDLLYTKALTENDPIKLKELVIGAKSAYNTVLLVDKRNLHAISMLAKIHKLSNNDRYAKLYYMRALGINPNDPSTNYYLGDFYYDKGDYRSALKYYKTAFANGLNENNKNMQKMANIYEKLGDLQRANLYYKKMFLINPSSQALPDKIRELEELKSQYYRGK